MMCSYLDRCEPGQGWDVIGHELNGIIDISQIACLAPVFASLCFIEISAA